MEAVVCDRQGSDGLVAEADAGGVLTAVEFGVHRQAGAAVVAAMAWSMTS